MRPAKLRPMIWSQPSGTPSRRVTTPPSCGGKNNTTGIGLVEAYDLDEAISPTLTNISTRGFVDTDQNVMIGGFISGNGIVRVIVRALGLTLSQFGVTNVLADPVLDVRDAQGSSLATNDDWAATQQAEIQASGKAPPNAKESAIIIVRPTGNTTAIVSGKGNTTGNALVEAYILPPIGSSRPGRAKRIPPEGPRVWEYPRRVLCGLGVKPLFWLRHRGILR